MFNMREVVKWYKGNCVMSLKLRLSSVIMPRYCDPRDRAIMYLGDESSVYNIVYVVHDILISRYTMI